MGKLRALLDKPAKPSERFHQLENYTKLKNIPKNDETWSLVRGFIESPNAKRRIIGAYLNYVITENKKTHLLSGAELNRLLSGQNLIPRKTMSNKEAASIFNELGDPNSDYQIYEILRPVVEGDKAAVVKIVDEDISNYIDLQIGREISASYEQSCLDFYDKVPSKVPLQSSTTTTSNNTTNAGVKTPANQDINNNAITAAAAAPSALKEPTVNQEHQKLLNQAIAACPHDKFLIGKQESLIKYGSFTEKQLKTLKNIIDKNQPTKPKIDKKKFNEILDKHKSDAAAVLAEFENWSFNQDDKSKFERCKFIVSYMLTTQLAEQVILGHIGEIYPGIKELLDERIKKETAVAARAARNLVIQPEKDAFDKLFEQLKNNSRITGYLIQERHLKGIIEQINPQVMTYDELKNYFRIKNIKTETVESCLSSQFNKSTRDSA